MGDSSWRGSVFFKHKNGQSVVEFALILPLFVLFIVGIFELGRAFFAFISITNAAREGARVVTFWPGKTTLANITTAVKTEIGKSPTVKWGSVVQPILVECGAPLAPVTTDAGLLACPTEQPLRVTVTYQFQFIFQILYSDPLMLKRSAQMMIP